MGMVEGTFPGYRAKSPAALEDERHNIFVAVTRSRRILVHHGVNKATIFNRQKAYCILVLTFDF